MDAIVTKYLSPTTTKGARISAVCGKHKIEVPFDYSEAWSEMNTHKYKNHRRAAWKLCVEKLKLPPYQGNGSETSGLEGGDMNDGRMVWLLLKLDPNFNANKGNN
jgi:hypothetical protein